jgi:hypothetical protein
MRVELQYPIPVEGKDGKMIETSSLTFTRIKAKHIKLLPDSVFDPESAGNIRPTEMIPLIAGITGIPIESAEEIDLADLIRIGGEVLPSFLAEFSAGTNSNGSG